MEPGLTNALFICSRNRLRSPTAEQVFSTWPDVDTDSAGLDNDAVVQLSPEQLEWADIVFVMERAHQARLSRGYGNHLRGKQIVCLNIPDDYGFMDPALIERLVASAGRYLK